jgi:AcrR family transcriptional regulator
MPAPAKTSDEAVVAAARAIVERDGAGALSMQAVAAAVGVRPPSLYKRFAHREALLDAVVADGLAELRTRLADVADDRRPRLGLSRMAVAYRAFARRSPGLYALMYAARAESPALLELRRAAVEPLMAALAEILPADDRLPAARLLTAYLHGFVSMEIGGGFRLGGEVQRAFIFGLDRILRAL